LAEDNGLEEFTEGGKIRNLRIRARGSAQRRNLRSPPRAPADPDYGELKKVRQLRKNYRTWLNAGP